MALFIRRFIGALVLDAGTFEDIEADRSDTLQAMTVVALAAAAGGIAAAGLGLAGIGGFLAGSVIVIGGWLVWVAVITVLGTITLPEPQTHSSMSELVRMLGFATAPGVFIALAAMRAVAPLVAVVVALWMLADAVLAMRQALDYRSTWRAAAVCAASWLVTVGILTMVAMLFTRTVN